MRILNYDHLERENEVLRAKMKLLVEALRGIGNVIGGPTMSYSPKIEREELLSRVQKVGNLVAKALEGL